MSAGIPKARGHKATPRAGEAPGVACQQARIASLDMDIPRPPLENTIPPGTRRRLAPALECQGLPACEIAGTMPLPSTPT